MTLEVGQKLWYVRTSYGTLPIEGREVTITKIGHKWAALDRGTHRIDIKTLWVDGAGFASPGRCWLNREAWEANERILNAWNALRRAIEARRSPPEAVTLDQIQHAATMLHVKLPD